MADKKRVHHRHASKGDASCHVTNRRFRDGYERIFGRREKDYPEEPVKEEKDGRR